MTQTRERWAVLAPRHGFFAKDGRGWYAGSSNRARGLAWPLPTTVRGAVCTATGRVLEAQKGGPNTAAEWLALKGELPLRGVLAVRAPAAAASWTADHLMWPAPADAVHLVGQSGAQRLRWWRPRDASPVSVLTAGKGDDDRVDAVAVGRLDTPEKPAPGPAWWTHGRFVSWLCGVVAAEARPGEPRLRVDTHVKIDPETLTAEKSMLWSADFRETLVPAVAEDARAGRAVEVHRWGVAARVGVNVDRVDAFQRVEVATLAGDRRLADVEHVTPDLGACPPPLLAAAEKQRPTALRLYAVTSAVFAGGWCPDGFDRIGDRVVGRVPGVDGDVVLTGAMVGRPIPISGWAMQASSDAGRGPKALAWAVPPGAVYGLRRASGEPFTTAQIEALWLAQWGQRQDDGFGVVVPGLEPFPQNT